MPSRSLTRSLHLALMCTLAVVPAARAALLGYYPLDGNFLDASGNANNGTPGPDAPTFVPGHTGLPLDQAASFSGTDSSQLFTVPININPAVNPQVTFGGWIHATATDPTRGFISNDQGGYGRTLDIDSRSGSTGYSAFAGNNAVIGSVAPTSGFDFVAVVYDAAANAGAGSVALYVNGATPITSTGQPPPGDSFLTIGRNPHYDNPFGGIIDDVFVYNQALPSQEINDIRLHGVPLLPGDANRDGKVDFTDLVILARNYNKTSAVWGDGDFDADGKVDFGDLVILARHYGQTVGGAALASFDPSFQADVERAFATVPEPSSGALITLLSVAIVRRRRR